MAAVNVTEGTIWKQILRFFFPIVFGTFFQQLYNTADAVIVGRFVGKEALAAVGGSTTLLVNLMVFFFVGLTSGVSVLISQYFGAGKDQSVSDAVHTGIVFALLCGLFMTAAGLPLARPALEMMNTPAETIEDSVRYLTIYLIGVTANLLYNMGSGILRAVGDSKRPLYFLIAACFVNIGLDLLFVAGMGMGVAGVALATVLSEVFSVILSLGCLIRTDECYRLEPGKLRVHLPMVVRVIAIGLPMGLQSVMYSISNIIIQSRVNLIGTDTVAAWAAYFRIDTVFWMIMNALGIAITTFVGQNYGAGKIDRLHRGVHECLAMAAAISVVITAFLFGAGRVIFSLFTTDPAVQRIGMDILHFVAPFYITYIGVEAYSGALRGIGDSLAALIITAFGTCILRVIWVAVMVPKSPDVFTILTSYPISWGVSSVIFVIYYYFFSPVRYFRRGKTKKKVSKNTDTLN
ncbi:MAG: MATE family efflux transporter [Clostridium sp.]|nr:MATE family efflux transporter [Clostridium sp.]